MNAGQGELKKDCDEEVDITVIDSRHITSMEVVSSSSKKEGILGDNSTTVDDSDMGKEDWEIYAGHDSFWEDGQRLTNSWYGIEKVPNDGLDEVCVQGMLNIENKNYIINTENGGANLASTVSEILNDGEDELFLEAELNIET